MCGEMGGGGGGDEGVGGSACVGRWEGEEWVMREEGGSACVGRWKGEEWMGVMREEVVEVGGAGERGEGRRRKGRGEEECVVG